MSSETLIDRLVVDVTRVQSSVGAYRHDVVPVLGGQPKGGQQVREAASWLETSLNRLPRADADELCGYELGQGACPDLGHVGLTLICADEQNDINGAVAQQRRDDGDSRADVVSSSQVGPSLSEDFG